MDGSVFNVKKQDPETAVISSLLVLINSSSGPVKPAWWRAAVVCFWVQISGLRGKKWIRALMDLMTADSCLKWVYSYCLMTQNWLSSKAKGRWVHLRTLGRSKHKKKQISAPDLIIHPSFCAIELMEQHHFHCCRLGSPAVASGATSQRSVTSAGFVNLLPFRSRSRFFPDSCICHWWRFCWICLQKVVWCFLKSWCWMIQNQ